MSKIEQHNLSPESLFISDIKAIIEQGRRMAYASVPDLEIWRTCAPNLTCTRPLPILQTRLQNLRMKVIDELCMQKMHICSGDSATSGCSITPQVVEQTVSQIAQQDGERFTLFIFGRGQAIPPTLFCFGRGQAIAPTLMKEGRG